MPGKFDKSEVVANDSKAAALLKQKVDAADDEDEAEFLKLSHEIALLEADLDKVNERKKNIQLINDQVGGWTRRVGEKLTEQVDPSLRPPDQDNIFKQPSSKKLPLSIVFSSISQMVSAQLEQIIADKQETGESAEAILVELIPDFVNEEYKTKNQRVRPESNMSMGPEAGGATGFNRSEVESRHCPTNKAGEEEKDHSEEKLNEDYAFLQKEQRDKFKAMKRAIEQKQADEARKNEK